MKQMTLGGLILAVAFSLWTAPAFGAPGDLDPSFGTGGVLQLQLDEYSIADAVAQLPSGRILLGGTVGKTGQGGTRDFLLAHVTTDGVLDATFGADGIATYSIFDAGSDEITHFLVQSDGKILVSGFGQNGLTFESIVARYNADGTPDTGFAANGMIVPAPGFAIAEDLNGNVLIGGNGSASTFTVTRYTSAGALDTGFGSGGTLTGTIPPAGTVNLATLNVDPEGRIVVGAKADDVDAVARYLSDGSPDTGFGNGGFNFTSCNNSDSIADQAFQSDGKIIVGVTTSNGVTNFVCLIRFTADGQVDNTFDGDGKIVTDIPGVTNEDLTAIDVMKDDRIVVGGQVNVAPADSAFFAGRYLANGTPDTAFGGDGFVFYDTSSGFDDFGVDVLALNDGRVLVSGAASREGASTDFDATLLLLQGDVTDLSLTETADRAAATVGDGSPVIFTIHAVNNGPLAAFGVEVTDTFPAALTVSSVTSTVGTCSGGPDVVCDLGVLDPGGDATITVTTTPAAAGTVVNTAVIAGEIGDSHPSDNTAAVTVTIAAAGGGTGGGGNGGGCQLIRE